MLSMEVLAKHIEDALREVPVQGFCDMMVCPGGHEREKVKRVAALEHGLEIEIACGVVLRIPYGSIDYYKAHSVGVLDIGLTNGAVIKLRN